MLVSGRKRKKGQEAHLDGTVEPIRVAQDPFYQWKNSAGILSVLCLYRHSNVCESPTLDMNLTFKILPAMYTSARVLSCYVFVLVLVEENMLYIKNIERKKLRFLF